MLPPSLKRHLKAYPYYLWITLLAIGLRIIWSIAVPVIPVSDSAAYDKFAQNLANCQNYGWNCHTPSAYWPVGTSFVYAILYRLFGQSYTPIVLFNLVLAGITSVLAMRLAEQWFGRRVAALTGILLAFWCSQIQFTTVLASEQLTIALTLMVLAVWEYEHLNLWSRAAIVGMILAAACYVRPTAGLIPVLLLILRYLSTRKVKENILATGIMLAVMGLLIAPWSIRNTQAFGQFVTISTNGGANLWMGNNPASNGGFMELPPETRGMNEAERDKYLKSLAIDHIKDQPFLFAKRTVQRLITTYDRESIGVAWNEPGLVTRYGTGILMPLKVLNQLYWLPMLGLGLIGAILLGMQRGWTAALFHPTILFWGYVTAIHAVIVAQDRYHFPAIPMIAMLAAFALIAGFDRLRQRKQGDRSIAPHHKLKQPLS
jgi:hypothetical protein